MSRLLKYIVDLSGTDEDLNEFRSLRIKLVDKELEYKQVVKRVQERYKLDTDMVRIIDELNYQLRKVYKGKFKFDFCLDGGKVFEEVKLRSKRIEKLKLKYFSASDKFSKAKTFIEKKESKR